jgi:hypothetical protein
MGVAQKRRSELLVGHEPPNDHLDRTLHHSVSISLPHPLARGTPCRPARVPQ